MYSLCAACCYYNYTIHELTFYAPSSISLSSLCLNRYFEHIRELDLSSCRVREIVNLNGDEFVNLRELNLDNNMLGSMRGLCRLFNLTVLRLNHNHITEFVPPTLPSGLEDPHYKHCGLHGLTSLEVLQVKSQEEQTTELIQTRT